MRYVPASQLPWPRRFLPWRDPDARRERRWRCPGHSHPSQEHHLSYGVKPEIDGTERGWTYDTAERTAYMYATVAEALADIDRRLDMGGHTWTEVIANYDPTSTNPRAEAEAFRADG